MLRRIGIVCLLGFAACNGGSAQRQDAGPGGAGGTTGTAGSGGGGTTGAAGGGASGTTGAAGGGAGGTTGAAGGGASGTTGAAGGGAGGTTGAAGGGVGGTTGAAGGGAGGTTGAAGGGAAGTGGAGGATTLKDRFPATRPATITASATITKNDVACVMVGTSTGCLAQNAPPCTPAGGQATVTLHLTIDAQDDITVEAPYQDMCAPDYFCAISGPGCPIPTSYPVPLVNHAYLYDPRSTDRCRRDMSGNLTQVEHDVDVSANGAASVTVHQVCHTRMRNDGTTPSSYVDDTRDWTTVISF